MADESRIKVFLSKIQEEFPEMTADQHIQLVNAAFLEEISESLKVTLEIMMGNLIEANEKLGKISDKLNG
ncbi:MAG TPA: hypothetical protein V6D29_06440 [Leptolyngbyaceae cyanobacterium]